MSYDNILYYFLRTLEEGTGVGFSVTLYMKGLVVEGNMIPSKKYYEELSKFLDQVITVRESLDSIKKEKFEKFKQDLKQSMESRTKNSYYDQEMYIYLDNATIYLSDSKLGRFAYLWRGKLSSVDSFSMGNSGNKYEDITPSE